MAPQPPVPHTGAIVAGAFVLVALVGLAWMLFGPTRRERRPMAPETSPRNLPVQIAQPRFNSPRRVLELAQVSGLTKNGSMVIFVPIQGNAPFQVARRLPGATDQRWQWTPHPRVAPRQHTHGWLVRYFSGQLRMAPVKSEDHLLHISRARYRPVNVAA